MDWSEKETTTKDKGSINKISPDGADEKRPSHETNIWCKEGATEEVAEERSLDASVWDVPNEEQSEEFLRVRIPEGQNIESDLLIFHG